MDVKFSKTKIKPCGSKRRVTVNNTATRDLRKFKSRLAMQLTQDTVIIIKIYFVNESKSEG